jgi:hypothetical protein
MQRLLESSKGVEVHRSGKKGPKSTSAELNLGNSRGLGLYVALDFVGTD